MIRIAPPEWTQNETSASVETPRSPNRGSKPRPDENNTRKAPSSNMFNSSSLIRDHGQIVDTIYNCSKI
jgi:hypothetical protein